MGGLIAASSKVFWLVDSSYEDLATARADLRLGALSPSFPDVEEGLSPLLQNFLVMPIVGRTALVLLVH
jgi:hypothetical protein